jgi:4-alpha-glucanotransferase
VKYSQLLNSKTSSKWQRIGISRRAGVALPLFSVYSKNSVGIGEIPDLRFVIDWCSQTGMSIVQLLPLNEVGDDFAPYNALSTFALEPMYLSFRKLRKVNLEPFRKDLRELKKNFPKGDVKVDYGIKNEKLRLLRKIFDATNTDEIENFRLFVDKNFHWLKYYSIFKVLARINHNKSWNDWELKHKYISSFAAEKIRTDNSDEIEFYYWLQWQLYEQLITIRKYAKRSNVLIMGDLPLLVSRNSADVWAYKNYFKLDLASGAPPDMYFSSGQKWGMPPYDWADIEADNYGYIRERLKYAENFYDMYRIDHFVGLFRIWTIDLKTPEEFGGLFGKFDPEEEYYWEEHGRKILSVMNDSTSMLPCAEDLGTIPECSERILNEFGVTGINVQRWEKSHGGNYNFLNPEDYRINSAATVSTHDSSSLPAWWKNEAGSTDALSFKSICEKKNITGNDFLYLRENLFEAEETEMGKLFWKKEISNVYVLLSVLRLNFQEAAEIINVYLSSFDEKNKFLKYIGLKEASGSKPPADFMKRSLEKISSADSIFSIQLIMEYLYLDKNILAEFSGEDFRINSPGTVNENNWSMVIPVSLESLKDMDINLIISKMIRDSGRILSG